MKIGNFYDKSTISSHAFSFNHLGAGFYGKPSLSKIKPPLKKKSNSSLSNPPLFLIKAIDIVSESSNLSLMNKLAEYS